LQLRQLPPQRKARRGGDQQGQQDDAGEAGPEHRRALTAVVLAAAGSAFGQNLIMNPSFEDTLATETTFNLDNPDFNALMTGVTAFGDRGTPEGELDIMDPLAEFGPAPIDGTWKIGLSHDAQGIGVDAFSFDLLAPLQAGTLYTLSFQALSVTEDFSPDLAGLDIGVSGVPDAFGTLIESTGLISDGGWQHIEFDFVAPDDASFLTVRGTRGPDAWSHLDDFSLVVVPSPGVGAVVLVGAGMLVLRRRPRG
ncbi:MAG: hypothetical protein HRU13_04795, partial [Phycisphaerales bacterium]|nr:hypothetical protein [Phycisphaerales bacterium]